MTWFEVIFLALIQGLTEFLPISSSGHLVLPELLLSWQSHGLAFDVAVHIGSLLAILLYFRKDLISLACGSISGLTHQKFNSEIRLVWLLVLATLPAIIAGFALKSQIETYARSLWVIGGTTLIFGVLLAIAYVIGKQEKNMDSLSWKGALWIGLMQAIAIVPGTSRSGITMTAGLFYGLSLSTAARFSFLLSIPVILGAGALATWDLLQLNAKIDWTVLGTGALASFLSAYACVHFFLAWIERVGMWPFIIYRLALGAILIGFAAAL